MSACIKFVKKEDEANKVLLTQCQFCGEGSFFSDESFAYLWILSHRCGL